MSVAYREIKNAIQFELVDNIDYEAHIHEDIEIMFSRKGSGYTHCNGKKFLLKENSFFISFPNQVHYYSDSTMGEFILLVVKPSQLLSYTEIFEEYEPVSSIYYHDESSGDNIVDLFERTFYEYMRDGESPVIDAYLTAFFGKLLKGLELVKKTEPSDFAAQIIKYCSTHYKENISLQTIADNLHISRSTVSHIFSKKIAMNFCEYINSLRLLEACKLLKNNELSITEVSQQSGFSTIRTFNRAFIKQYGTTPTEYRKMILNLS